MRNPHASSVDDVYGDRHKNFGDSENERNFFSQECESQALAGRRCIQTAGTKTCHALVLAAVAGEFRENTSACQAPSKGISRVMSKHLGPYNGTQSSKALRSSPMMWATTSTGCLEWRATASVTLPNTQRPIPERLWVHITIRLPGSLRLSAMISSAAKPSAGSTRLTTDEIRTGPPIKTFEGDAFVILVAMF